MIKEGDRQLVIYVDISDKANLMLPYVFLYFISRWAKRHDVLMKAEVERGEHKVLIRLNEWSLYFEEALHVFTNSISNNDVDIFILHCYLDDEDEFDDDEYDEYEDVIAMFEEWPDEDEQDEDEWYDEEGEE